MKILKRPLACLAIIALGLLSGCKIIIETPAEGAVTTVSNQFRCDHSSVCEIDVSDTFFSESFHAIAKEGYIFTGWEKRDRGLCGNSLANCNLSTTEFSKSQALLRILESDEAFYLKPRFGLASEHYSIDRVVDGDSLYVLNQYGESIHVRLFGVDAPERDQPYGDQATLALETHIRGGLVRIEVLDTDRYGRLIVNMYLPDGTYVNLSLVEQGLAWWSEYYAPDEEALARAHQEAKNAERGLWAGENPIEPYQWRDGVR